MHVDTPPLKRHKIAPELAASDHRGDVPLNGWIPRWNLTTSHRKGLLDKSRLDDAIINAMQDLIAEKYASQGWQPVAMGKIGYDFAPAPSVQILHNGSNHWLASASTSQGIYVADSLLTEPNSATKQQLLCLYRSPLSVANYIDVTYIPVQKQRGRIHCGDFAVAFAAAFASRQSPSTISNLRFDQDIMRRHLFTCLKDQSLTEMPPSLLSFPVTLPKQVTYRIYQTGD